VPFTPATNTPAPIRHRHADFFPEHPRVATPGEPTAVGNLHTAAALPVFLGLPAVALAGAWSFRRHGQPGWAAYSAATAPEVIWLTVGLLKP
jgi:hypothetical protein